MEGAFDKSEIATVSNTSSSGKKSLNKVCDEIYGREKTAVAVDGSEDSKKNLMNDM